MIPTKPADATRLFSRRQFLQTSGIGFMAAIGLSISPIMHTNRIGKRLADLSLYPDYASEFSKLHQNLDPNQQGRMLDPIVDVYDIPSFGGVRQGRFYRDRVLPITDVTIGKSDDSFNIIWYKLGTDGFAHSGSIQPVTTRTNPVVQEIPKGGALAELTVPFTDARWGPDEKERVAYRFYYETTHWVTEIVKGDDDITWYGVRDDKWEYIYYVNASHLRLVDYDELKPISAHIPAYAKRLEVHLPEQVMIALEYDQPIFMARVATGAIFSHGDYSTPPGRYTTFHKRPSRHMARGNLAANGYDLPGVPWNSYITEDGIAFHGTYWHNNFGRTRSHGCINLTPRAAKWIYLWTLPAVPPNEEWLYESSGTIVDIFD